MTKISICIPIEDTSADPARLVTTLLKNPLADIELILAGETAALSAVDARRNLPADARLVRAIVETPLARQRLWRRAVEAATGDWVTLINPSDMLESEIETVATYIEQSSPETDAIAWTVFQIASDATPETAGSVAIPASYHINLMDKTRMLTAFFHWEGSLDAPKMPFGLFHGLIRRSLVDAILQVPENLNWSTPVPQYEWAAKVLLFSEQLTFCARPLSAAEAHPYRPDPAGVPQFGFPFHSGIGLAAAIAEAQAHVLGELGSDWNGGNEAFVRACMIDCMRESTEAGFEAKGNAYFTALRAFDGGRLAGAFRPGFAGAQKADKRRGLYGEALLVDRFIGGARTPQDFFAVMGGMIAPIGLICGGVTR